MAFEIPDLDGVEAAEQSAPMAPPGRYLLMVVDAEETTNETSKNKTHWYTFSVMGGEHHGKISRQNFNLSHDYGKQLYKGFLVALGFTAFKGLNTDATKGRPVVATVVEEEFTIKQGKNAGKKGKSSKAIEFASGKDAFAKFVQAQSGGGAPAEAAAATAGQSEKQLGF